MGGSTGGGTTGGGSDNSGGSNKTMTLNLVSASNVEKGKSKVITVTATSGSDPVNDVKYTATAAPSNNATVTVSGNQITITAGQTKGDAVITVKAKKDGYNDASQTLNIKVVDREFTANNISYGFNLVKEYEFTENSAPSGVTKYKRNYSANPARAEYDNVDTVEFHPENKNVVRFIDSDQSGLKFEVGEAFNYVEVGIRKKEANSKLGIVLSSGQNMTDAEPFAHKDNVSRNITVSLSANANSNGFGVHSESPNPWNRNPSWNNYTQPTKTYSDTGVDSFGFYKKNDEANILLTYGNDAQAYTIAAARNWHENTLRIMTDGAANFGTGINFEIDYVRFYNKQ